MKQQLTKEQSRKLIELGVHRISTIGDLLDSIPPFKRGKLTIMRNKEKWVVGSLYSESISHSEANAVWKIRFYEKELIDAVYKFIVWSVESKGSGFYY